LRSRPRNLSLCRFAAQGDNGATCDYRGFTAALIAALIIGLVNATLGLFLKIITLPLTFLTLGIFWWVINALMLMFASALLAPNFVVTGFWPAFWGAIVLSLVNMLLRAVVRDLERP